MCGVTGEVSWVQRPESELIRAMTSSLSHRGPDGESYWVGNHISLGHTRLAIIDLDTRANQPMISDDGSLVLSYNGEVYNFKEIRAELSNLGYTFKTTSDSEVVLSAWREWGEACVSKFNGMFAFALADTHKQQLFLVRDRYGIKPMYFYHHDGGLIFSSEQRAFEQHPLFKKRLNIEALLEYMTFQNFFSDETLVQKVKILKPGHILKVDITKRSLFYTQFWDFDFSVDDQVKSAEECEEELGRLLQQAISRQLVSDVEVGCYLSGGMDSGSITSIASRTSSDLKTFTCGFDLSSANGIELAFDERAQAEMMSGVFGTEHYQMVLKAGDMQRSLPSVVDALEEPRVGQSYPNYYAAKLASHFVKVVLAGTGGDEIFAGYPWRYFTSQETLNQNKFSNLYFEQWQRLLSNDELRNVFSPMIQQINIDRPREVFDDVIRGHKWADGTVENQINQCLYFESKTFLHGLLVVEDKLSMHHGLETRLPFLDNDLVNFGMKCPVSYKINLKSSKSKRDENTPGRKSDQAIHDQSTGKMILRRAMLNYLPTSTVSRPKQGFSGPDGTWFRGTSINFVKQRILDPKSPVFEILNRQATTQLVDEHFNGQRNRRLLVWSLLCLDEILRNDDFVS